MTDRAATTITRTDRLLIKFLLMWFKMSYWKQFKKDTMPQEYIDLENEVR